ncbi:MAG: aconitate hydratase 1, partial [Acidobacteria bacterium]|nr:aconitate hydratase 1 [Acidobacteriota bacterium]
MPHNTFNTLDSFDRGNGQRGQFYSLRKLEEAGIGPVSKLPVSIRIVLESVLRNVDGRKISEADVRALANWQCNAERTEEIPFMVERVLLQDFTGVPLLVDLAAMRSAAARKNTDPDIIEPLVPVDLVVDHSVQVDFSNRPDSLEKNMEIEFRRNQQRYEFLKWGTQAFNGFQVVPPGIGIVHQVNLEYLARGVMESGGVFYPDSLVGTDSHTTMINGLGIVGWGVGGIEAEAGMLGQPVYFLTPDVVGVHLSGVLTEGVTATDLVLTITQLLRQAKVVGKFVEYFGEGAASLALADRATIANMAPEYGATMGYFPVDEESCRYLALTGRTEEQIAAVRNYYTAQGLFGIPRKGEVEYTKVLELDLSTVRASVAGPKRPQDRIELDKLKQTFVNMLQAEAPNGYNKPASEIERKARTMAGITPATAAVVTGGGEQTMESVPAGQETRNTSELTEYEMVNNRPTPDRVESAELS